MPAHACLPTSERLAVVTGRPEVGVQNAAKILEGVSTLSEGSCGFVAASAVTSVFAECGGAGGRFELVTPEGKVIGLDSREDSVLLTVVVFA